MARISTYAIDGTPVSSDKLIGTDTAGTVTKNYPLGDIAYWLKSSGATAVLGQNNYLFQIALDPDEGRKIGSFSFENYGGDGTEFSAVTELKFSASSSTGQYVSDYLLSTVGQKVLISQLDAPNNFGIYALVSLTQSSLEPTFYDAVLAFVDGNGALQGNESYGLATYSALNEAGGGTWGSITGTITNQTDLVDYIDAEIAAIPTPPTPTLQSVTNEGNTTTNAISAGTITANNELHLVDSAMRIFRSSNDMRFRTNNSDNMTITSTGRVGIGTTNPISKLELQDGTFTVDNGNIDVFFGGISISRNSANNTALKVNQRGTADIFALQDDGTDVLTVIDGGNVGIGTTNPLFKLEVVGDARIDGGPFIIRGTNSFTTSSDTSGVLFNLGSGIRGFRFQNTNGELIRIDASGNVGIGTTAPDVKLVVDEPTTNNLTVAKFKHQQGGVVSNVVFENSAGADNTGFNLNFKTGAGAYGGVLGVIRTNSPSAGDADMFLSSSGGEAMRITSGGNVGIGTNSPAHVLHINKDNPYIQIQDSSAPTRADMSAGIIMKDSTGAQSFGITQSNSVDVSIRANAGDLSLGTFAGTVIKLDGNNVGIGTTAPTAKLHIVDATDPTFKIGDASNRNITLRGGTSSRTPNISSYSGLGLGGSDGAFHAFINNVGNVGIGTTAPNHLFSVNNKFMVTSTGSAFIPAGQGIGIDPYSGGTATNIYFNTGNVQVAGATDFTHNNASFIVKNSGNVGIGTTAPDSKLHVKATSGIAFKVDPNSADKEWYIDTTNPDHLKKEGNFILNADPTNVHTSTKISFNIDGSNKASINSDGDLGVGTTAQTSKLHVDGTAMRQLRIGTAGGPSSNTDTSGAEGDIAYDDLYLYIKTGSGWGRVALDFAF